ncbi:MAG: hypothetical protein J6A08_02725 [Lachnospiraceae bacterium]|nr:hypothetical protein [Lachnospiraceae bacterium]
MDWQNQPNNPYNNGNPYGNGNLPLRSVPVRPKGDGMASAALVLGIISIACLFFMQIYVPFITGGIGIVLGILSRGNARKLLGKAKAGITCCIIGLAADILLCAGSVYLVINLPTLMPEIVDEVNEMCEEQYGFSYDELMEELDKIWNTETSEVWN